MRCDPGVFEQGEVHFRTGNGVKILNQPVPPAFKGERPDRRTKPVHPRQRTRGRPRPPRHEFSIQMRAMDADKSDVGLGLAVLVALCGSLLGKNTRGGTIVVGALNLGGLIEMIPNAVQIAELAIDKTGADFADAGSSPPAVERPTRRTVDGDQHRVLQRCAGGSFQRC